MKKKEYILPLTEVIEIDTVDLLLTSDFNSNLSDEDADENARSRELELW